jgi:hypothetical protein
MCTIISGHEHNGAPAITAEGIVAGTVVVTVTVSCYRILEAAWPILLPMWAVACVIVWMPCWARAAFRAGLAALMRLIGQGVAATHAVVTTAPEVATADPDLDAIAAPTTHVVLRNGRGEIIASGKVPVIGGSREATLNEVKARYVQRQRALAGRPR